MLALRVVATCLALVSALGIARAQDRDADHVADALDLCPDAPERDADLLPGDGCPDADGDGDGVVDDYDVCPSVRETANGFEDADGCPDVDAAAIRVLAERIHFETAEHTLASDAMPIVRRLAAFLVAHAEIALAEIEGHADARGDDAANLALSQRRAEAVRDALVAAGVPSARVSAVGQGALPGDSAAIQAENRRCDVRVTLATPVAPPLDLSALAGRWGGSALLDLDVAAGARARVREGASAWLGPARAILDCYAGRQIGERWALHCRGVGVEATLLFRAIDANHLVGLVQGRSAGVVDRAAWSATRVGAFDQQNVVRMIQAHRSEIQACYERELPGLPTLAGRVAVVMTIEESGATEAVRVASDTMTPPAPALGACVARIIDAFEFSPGPLGGSVTYTFPFVFEAQDGPPPAVRAMPPDAGTAARAYGYLTPEQIMAVVRANQAAVRRCYEQRLQTQPTLAGRIEIAWRIGLDGAVRTTRVARSTMGDLDVEGCIAHELLGWRFPPPDGGEVDVVFPFIFGPGAHVAPTLTR